MKHAPYSKQYLIYTRKSTDDADNQKNSIDYQVGQCLKYSNENHLLVADFEREGFCENGVIKERHTAYKTSELSMNPDGSFVYRIDRPKFNILMDLLMKRQFAGVIILCWDRISRNDQDGVIIKSLMDRGVDIRFVQTKYEKTSSGALHRDIDGMFASHYSRVISEKVKAAYEKLQGEGKCTYLSPLGYLDYGSANKPLDEERAHHVKRIFELYAEGDWSFEQLAKWANKQGLTSKPTRKTRSRKEMLAGESNFHPKVSRAITHKSIEHILKNPFYIGKLIVRGEVISGIHQPLISVSLFNKVQQVLKERNVTIHYVDKEFFHISWNDSLYLWTIIFSIPNKRNKLLSMSMPGNLYEHRC
jgi:site-specific DNA recombinase